mmetsp:Transcript_105419/g.263863  ORF Transcript_105419/g.263863 Transcript_105419/m.263863 type:complete len:213 (-) Transcript_105419:1038-1676(-)
MGQCPEKSSSAKCLLLLFARQRGSQHLLASRARVRSRFGSPMRPSRKGCFAERGMARSCRRDNVLCSRSYHTRKPRNSRFSWSPLATYATRRRRASASASARLPSKATRAPPARERKSAVFRGRSGAAPRGRQRPLRGKVTQEPSEVSCLIGTSETSRGAYGYRAPPGGGLAASRLKVTRKHGNTREASKKIVKPETCFVCAPWLMPAQQNI